MSRWKQPILPICILLVTIVTLLIPAVSAGSSIAISSTGKFIFKPMDYPNIVLPANQKEIFFFINTIPSKTLHYDENATACGINGCGGNGDYPNYNVIMNIPIQPHFNMSIKLPPAVNPLINSETQTACCGGNPFVKPYQNPW